MLTARIHTAFIFSLLMISLLSSCSRDHKTQVQGYIEGRYTYVATSVSGFLRELSIDRGARVKQGERLFVLEEQPESDVYLASSENLKQALSQRDAIIANLAYAKITYERYKTLVPKNAIDQSHLDNAKSNYDALLAQLSQANAHILSTQAMLAQAKWNVDQKIIASPVDAIVFDTYFRIGEYADVNQPILSLIAPQNIKAIFYVQEGALAQLKLNDMVSVNCDNCKQSHPGKISFISPSAEYTPPVIFSNQTNDKLVYRIEAEFTPEVAYQFHPGQPVYVTYTYE